MTSLSPDAHCPFAIMLMCFHTSPACSACRRRLTHMALTRGVPLCSGCPLGSQRWGTSAEVGGNGFQGVCTPGFLKQCPQGPWSLFSSPRPLLLSAVCPFPGPPLPCLLGLWVLGSKSREETCLCGRLVLRAPALSLSHPRARRPQAPGPGVFDRCLHCQVPPLLPLLHTIWRDITMGNAHLIFGSLKVNISRIEPPYLRRETVHFPL